MTQLIGLTGFARVGKDTIAKHLVNEHGYLRLNFGDVIKGFFDDFTQRLIDPDQLEVKITEHLYAEKSEDDLKVFMDTIVWPFWLTGVATSAFTENNTAKSCIRPILEHGGELIYGWCMEQYEAQVMSAIAEGRSVVNTRVCMPDGQEPGEVHMLRSLGFTIAEVVRSNWAAASEWEAQGIRRMRDAGLIDVKVINNSLSSKSWEVDAAYYADVLADKAGREAA